MNIADISERQSQYDIRKVDKPHNRLTTVTDRIHVCYCYNRTGEFTPVNTVQKSAM